MPDKRVEFDLVALESIIATRSTAGSEMSYTSSLLEKGPPYCARKLGEEAIETVLAIAGQERPAVISETADLLYHLLVALRARGVEIREVLAELQRRTIQSGHVEKASRTAEPPA